MNPDKLFHIFEKSPVLPTPEEEALKRPERLAYLEAQILELFPGADLEGLREEIRESLDTPQFGIYHKEGMLMDSHVIRILKNIADIKAGKFSLELPPEIKEILQSTVTEHFLDFCRYAFLHDLAKKDCLTLKYPARNEELSWEEYCRRFPEATRTDPSALAAALQAQEIISVGYYQTGNKRKHGASAVKNLSARFSGQFPEILLTAINKHEVAFEFKVDKTLPLNAYTEHFSKLSAEQIAWVLVASYIDTTASLRENGQPDLTNFQVMLDTMHNYQVIQLVEAAIFPGGQEVPGLERKKVENFLINLRAQRVRLTDDVGALLAQAKVECLPSKYDRENLRAALSTIEGLALEEINLFCQAILSDGLLDNRLFGKTKREILKRVGKELGRDLEDKINFAFLQAEQ